MYKLPHVGQIIDFYSIFIFNICQTGRVDSWAVWSSSRCRVGAVQPAWSIGHDSWVGSVLTQILQNISSRKKKSWDRDDLSDLFHVCNLLDRTSRGLNCHRWNPSSPPVIMLLLFFSIAQRISFSIPSARVVFLRFFAKPLTFSSFQRPKKIVFAGDLDNSRTFAVELTNLSQNKISFWFNIDVQTVIIYISD